MSKDINSNAYDVTSISCGRDHTLALLSSGKVMGWGGDGSGRQLNTAFDVCSTIVPPTHPGEVSAQSQFLSIAAGHSVSLGLTDQYEVVVWGSCATGVGGQLDAVAVSRPQRVTGLPSAQVIVAGEFHFAAIDQLGAIHSWGLNTTGMLGRVSETLNSIPGPVIALPPIKHIALGQGFMLALTRDGRLYSWGGNTAGQLGLGHLNTVDTPIPISLPMRIEKVSAGATHLSLIHISEPTRPY